MARAFAFIPAVPGRAALRRNHCFSRMPWPRGASAEPRRRARLCMITPSAATSLAGAGNIPPDDELPYEPPVRPILSAALARSSLAALLQYYRDIARQEPFLVTRLVLALACICLSKAIGIAVPFLFKRIVDMLTLLVSKPSTTASSGVAATLPLVFSAIFLHAFARVAASVAHELRNAVFAKAGQRIGRRMTATTFAHLHSLEAEFHNSSQTGALTRVVDRGTRSVLTIFRGLLFAFLPSLFELALVCVVLFTSFSAWYAIVTVCTFVTYLLWTFRINDKMAEVRGKLNDIENETSAILTDSLVNVEAVQAFDNARFELERYDDALSRYEQIAILNEWLYTGLNVGQGIIFTACLTAVFVMAAVDVVAGTLTVGSLILLSTMLAQLSAPLMFLGWQYREVKQSLIDLQNLFDVLSREPKIKDAPNAKTLVVTKGEIEFDNVSFTYPEDSTDSLSFLRKSWAPSETDVQQNEEHAPPKRRRALRNLSFTAGAGESTALVGSSGSGKSTTTRLLYRLYDLTEGRILIDGQDVSKVTLSSLRQAVSIVPQDTALFNETIEYNIRYGRPSATREEVVAAAKAASIHDVILRTPLGYNTLVGERGVRLSGGERQRLSVARAFLKGSQIVIEDESTSALDTLTEMEVTNALKELGVNRTRVTVAHRLSTVIDSDKIVVLRRGRKVEEGTSAALLAINGGVFKGMWRRQQDKKTRSILDEADAAVEEMELITSDYDEEGEEEKKEGWPSVVHGTDGST